MFLRVQKYQGHFTSLRHAFKSVRVLHKIRQSGITCTFIGLLVTACADDSIFSGGGSVSGLACPQVAVLNTPGELTRFSDGKIGTLSDVLFHARMEMLDSHCDIEKEAVFMTTDARLIVIRGPAETKREVKFAFFFAVLNGQREVITREAFPIIVKFEGPERRFEFEDSLTVQIDLQPNVDPASYSIYAGFGMSPEELEFNRRRQR